MAVDVKHPLPDWRKHPAYLAQAAKLETLRAALPDLDMHEASAMMAASEAQDALDETETLALANRAKPRDVELKRTALEAAHVRLREASAKRAQAQRDIRLLEGGVTLLRDDARAEVARILSDAALAALERLERALADVVAANEDALTLYQFILQQFPGALPGTHPDEPTFDPYPAALNMPLSPWRDLRQTHQAPGMPALIETRYAQWCQQMREWKANRLVNANLETAKKKSA